MKEVAKLTCATPKLGIYWNSIDWKTVNVEVKQLQMRIAKAVEQKKWNRVKSLQWILSHSFSAKLLAVKRVTSRKGAKTAGTDGVVWNTPAKKMRGALSLQRRGYKAMPLRRVLIPKKNGKMRPLSIPTLKDRAMQALYLLALEPVSESTADPNSYGFRPQRACRDAIGQCFIALGRKHSPTWVLDADIKACFDWISHDWMIKNIPVDTKILKQWLNCGFVQNKKLFPTRNGAPQGGVASPTLANMALDGLEKAVRDRPRKLVNKVNFIRYADDFIITASSREYLEDTILPIVKSFLAERGLAVSEEKTKIVHIEQGFEFLGQNIRKYNNKLIIKPAKANVESFRVKVNALIRKGRGWNAETMIKNLNPVIRGWANYHRNVQSSKTFDHMHRIIYEKLRKWAKVTNRKKTYRWIYHHFFAISPKGRFSCIIHDKRGKQKLLELVAPVDIKLVRYIKIKGHSNPFNSEYKDYFNMRRRLKNYNPINNNSTAGLPLNEDLMEA